MIRTENRYGWLREDGLLAVCDGSASEELARSLAEEGETVVKVTLTYEAPDDR